MLAFARAPSDPRRIIAPEDRSDEIGVAERELADMQRQLQKTLGEQKHLADLGLAVSKINHDMRNILASAQLLSRPTERRARSVRAGGRAEAVARARPRRRPIRKACSPMAARRKRHPRGAGCGCNNWSTRSRTCSASTPSAASNSSTPSMPASRSTPIPSSFSGCSPTCARNAVQAMAGDDSAAVVRRLTISADRHRQRQHAF